MPLRSILFKSYLNSLCLSSCEAALFWISAKSISNMTGSLVRWSHQPRSRRGRAPRSFWCEITVNHRLVFCGLLPLLACLRENPRPLYWCECGICWFWVDPEALEVILECDCWKIDLDQLRVGNPERRLSASFGLPFVSPPLIVDLLLLSSDLKFSLFLFTRASDSRRKVELSPFSLGSSTSLSFSGLLSTLSLL